MGALALLVTSWFVYMARLFPCVREGIFYFPMVITTSLRGGFMRVKGPLLVINESVSFGWNWFILEFIFHRHCKRGQWRVYIVLSCSCTKDSVAASKWCVFCAVTWRHLAVVFTDFHIWCVVIFLILYFNLLYSPGSSTTDICGFVRGGRWIKSLAIVIKKSSKIQRPSGII